MKTQTCDTDVNEYFRRKGFRIRLRACLLAPYWNILIETMRGWAYGRHVIYTTIEHALRLAEFAAHMSATTPRDLTDELVDAYHQRQQQHPRMLKESRRCLRLLMQVLREHGVIPAVIKLPVLRPAILDDYLHFLAEHRGIGTDRIERHRVHVEAFLQSLGDANTCSDIDSEMVSRFITTHAPALGRTERKAMCAALRTLLRFLQFRGVVTQDFTTAVPVIPSFKLDRLPRAIAWEDIQKILAVVDRSTPVGCRDYALLLMLATYGIRCGQLCELRLDDIDWRHNILRIRATKGGRLAVLPLRPAVGEALVDYVRHGRPTWPFREVFLRTRAPMGPLGRNLGNIIKWYARKAGVSLISFGPHAWRHACATRMLAHGQTLKTIRDVLGHRTIETTFIYTKIDIEHLRQAALEWPEVTS